MPGLPAASTRFRIGTDDFELDGRPHRVIAGALHYFRVHPDQWADRIRKARLMGLDTIETYVAWNAHSPERGAFDTSAGLDLGRFLDLVHAEGMHAIVRPGPYISASGTAAGCPAGCSRIPRWASVAASRCTSRPSTSSSAASTRSSRRGRSTTAAP